MSWLNLLTPSAAVIAIFLALALVIQSFRHGRAIRRLEQQLASAGLSAYDPTIDRLKRLSETAKADQAASARAPLLTRRTLAIAGVVIAILLVAGGAFALVRHSTTHSAKSTATTPATHTQASSSTTASAATTPAVVTSCADAKPIADPAAVTVSVYNGTAVAGAAGRDIGPKLTALGYTLGAVANAPDGAQDTTATEVQYATHADFAAACSVATALGVSSSQVGPLSIVSAAADGGAGVVVLIGQDLVG